MKVTIQPARPSLYRMARPGTTRASQGARRAYELGPEPEPDDIDGRSPCVVAWHDADMFLMIAGDELFSDELLRIAISLYE